MWLIADLHRKNLIWQVNYNDNTITISNCFVKNVKQEWLTIKPDYTKNVYIQYDEIEGYKYDLIKRQLTIWLKDNVLQALIAVDR